MATGNYQGKKFIRGDVKNVEDHLTQEQALQININNKPFTVSMRTPGNDMSLVRGMLHSEGILNNVNYFPELILKKENEDGIVTVVNLDISKKELGEGYSNSRIIIRSYSSLDRGCSWN